MLPRLADWTDKTDKSRKKWLVVKKMKGAMSSNRNPFLLVS